MMEAQTYETRKLTAEDVDVAIDPKQFSFKTTDELEPLDRIVGQPRALRALEMGLAVRHPSYNIFVAGVHGMGKMGMIQQALAERVGREATPPDWIYVNNFDEADRPLAISLDAGQARRLKNEMERLVRQLAEELPKAFQEEDLSRRKQQLSQHYQREIRDMSEDLEKRASEKGLAVQQLSDGNIVLIPTEDGEPMSEAKRKQLSDEQREELDKRRSEFADEFAGFMSRQREVMRRLRNEVEQLERDFAAQIIQPLVDEVAAQYEGDKLLEWFGKLKEDMINHWDRFREKEEGGQEQQMAAMMGMTLPSPEERYREYQVNVLVDNSQVEGAPVVIEDAPNYKNLFGIIDRAVDRTGREVTDFTRIKAGSLLRGGGGYVVINMIDALIEPVVWKELKRTVKRGSLQIEAYEPLGMFSTTALKPEPIPLDVKLVVVGSPLIYHLLYMLDEDFAEIFKVKCEFDPEMGHDTEAANHVARLLEKLRHVEKILPFEAEGVAEVIRTAAREAADKNKLTTEFSRLADVAREASFWASRENAPAIGRRHVTEAVKERVYRSDLIAEKIREMIADGRLRINIDGESVGQLNGLSVADLGDYRFARPTRVTAGIGVGSAGVINIERESKLSGSTYDKGLLILEGYLRNEYADEHPLALSASLAMEQSYGMIDGDSASAAELFCLLSALADVPLRQDIAVTGSVNQRGEIQAVGGLIEKIEGFFEACQQRGLTGQQGVMIPATNIRNVVLRPDVIDAVRDEKFHIWAIEHVDQGLELLTGRRAGDRQQEDTFHWRVDQRLQKLAGTLKEQGPGAAHAHPYYATMGDGPRDPRPPLPGRDRD